MAILSKSTAHRALLIPHNHGHSIGVLFLLRLPFQRSNRLRMSWCLQAKILSAKGLDTIKSVVVSAKNHANKVFELKQCLLKNPSKSFCGIKIHALNHGATNQG